MESKMMLNDAILKSLEELDKAVPAQQVYNHIVFKEYYHFTTRVQEIGTPEFTVSSRLGDFIRNGDSRVKRIKRDVYLYYLAKNEQKVFIQLNDRQSK